MRRRFSWVITSPPGMATYRPDGWLRGWLLGGLPEPDYDRAGQLGALRGERFIEGLAEVWRATAARCRPGARLVVRFGALPSARGGDPGELLLSSLQLAGGWEVCSVTDAGIPPATGDRRPAPARPASCATPAIMSPRSTCSRSAAARREPSVVSLASSRIYWLSGYANAAASIAVLVGYLVGQEIC